jgi:hypothetical protein
MSIIAASTLFIGSMSGIAKYKQQPLDYNLIGTYFGIITPYQIIGAYSNLDVLSKIRLQGSNPFIHVPMAILMLSVANGSIFGIGYVLGKSSYAAFSMARKL